MSKRFKNVASLLEEVVDDADFVGAVRQTLARRNISKTLSSLRAAKGLTQKELAERIGNDCSQSRISKIEHAQDEELSLKDIQDYSRALSTCISLQFGEPKTTATELVKYHAFRIRDHLMKLAELAGNDPDIRQGVADFHVEAMSNIMALIMQGAQKLEPDPSKRAELLRLPPSAGQIEITVPPRKSAATEKEVPAA